MKIAWESEKSTKFKNNRPKHDLHKLVLINQQYLDTEIKLQIYFQIYYSLKYIIFHL